MKSCNSRKRPKAISLRLACTAVLLAATVIFVKAEEGYSNKLWFNSAFDYNKSEKLLLELNFEPKFQINGQGSWKNVDVTGLSEYYPNDWLDLTGELTLGASSLLPDLNSFEITPRIGIRIHFFSTVQGLEKPERTPLKRIGLSNWARMEVRNFSYSGDSPAKHELLFRNRFEVRIPINNELMHIDRTFSLMSDLEAFVPISGEILERFATQWRFRIGFGYRISYAWRLELLYIGERALDTLNDDQVATIESLIFKAKFNF